MTEWIKKRKERFHNFCKQIFKFFGGLTWCMVHVQKDTLRMSIFMLTLIALALISHISKKSVNFETIANSAVVTAIIDSLAWLICAIFQWKSEDIIKLTDDYAGLAKKYNKSNLIKRGNLAFPGVKIFSRRENDAPFHFSCCNSKNSYCIPEQVVEKSHELIKAHASSLIYNSQTLRLENCAQSNEGSTVLLTYTMVNYYDLLLTNRAMDYPFTLRFSFPRKKEDNQQEEDNNENKETTGFHFHTMTSIRELYEPGPFLSPLSEDSKLSNHLGFNGFVAFGEGHEKKILFVKRGKDVSIGKNVWGPSVSSAYQVQHGLNEKREMNDNTIGEAIRQAIIHKLKIPEVFLPDNLSLTETIFAFYRDLVEGGKPHFAFYFPVPNSNLTDAGKHFKVNLEKDDQSFEVSLEKGNFQFFALEELRSSTIQPDKLVPENQKALKMHPLGTVPLVLLLEYFE